MAEKEYEINYLRKKLEDEKLAFTGGAIGSDAIATKIVDMSKRVRELNAELESERTKNKQISKQCQDLKYKLDNKADNKINKGNDDESDDLNEKLSKENRELKEKLNASNTKTMELKSQCEILKQDLKKMHKVCYSRISSQLMCLTTVNFEISKVLEREIGENVDVKGILGGQTGWRGRQQQINSLQNKVSAVVLKRFLFPR